MAVLAFLNVVIRILDILSILAADWFSERSGQKKCPRFTTFTKKGGELAGY